MKKKIICIVFCTLLIATVLPISSSITDDKSNNTDDENKSLKGMLPLIPYNLPSEEYAQKQKNVYTKSTLGRGWNWLPSYTNYAPSGMPDFYQKQDNWQGIVDGGNGIAESTAMGDDVQITPVGQPTTYGDVIAPGVNCALESTPAGDDRTMWMFCCAVSTANCFWYLDSKYDDPDGLPGDGEDNFPLVKDYGAGDDHATNNAPLFIMKMANALNITSTLSLYFEDWIDTVDTWFIDAGLENHLEFNFYSVPTFDFIAGEIEQGKCVILIVYFLMNVGGQCVPVGNHVVTCAGINLEELKIAICDPYWDIANPSGPNHNDAQYVSYDIYNVSIGSPCPNYPEIEWWLTDYWPYYDFSVPYDVFIINTTFQPPGPPTIDGLPHGKIKTVLGYNFTSVDPDNDDIAEYIINWGDGTGNKTITGPFASGQTAKGTHTWNKKGDYIITAKAKDIYGNESSWVTFEVSISRDKALFTTQTILVLLLERFPNTFQIFKNFFRLWFSK